MHHPTSFPPFPDLPTEEGEAVSEVAAAATDLDRNSIYVLTEDGKFWVYDLESRKWEAREPVPGSNAAEGGYDVDWQ